jgi:hypothetical protein
MFETGQQHKKADELGQGVHRKNKPNSVKSASLLLTGF